MTIRLNDDPSQRACGNVHARFISDAKGDVLFWSSNGKHDASDGRSMMVHDNDDPSQRPVGAPTPGPVTGRAEPFMPESVMDSP